MAESQTNDERWLQEIRAGKEAAFRELYARYQGILFRFALHMTGSVATAEDITHDVFTQLICKPGSYNASKGPPLCISVRDRAKPSTRFPPGHPSSSPPLIFEDL